MPDIKNTVTPEELPENYRPVAEDLGMDVALKLSEFFGGTSIYIPKLDYIHRRVRNNSIRKEFNGFNIPELCRKYDLTETQIRVILRAKETTIEDFLEENER